MANSDGTTEQSKSRPTEKVYKNKVQQNQMLVAKVTQQIQAIITKAKTLPKDTSTKTAKVKKNLIPETNNR